LILKIHRQQFLKKNFDDYTIDFENLPATIELFYQSNYNKLEGFESHGVEN
jgi:hypothetical protein